MGEMVVQKENGALEARRRCGGDETELDLGLSLGKKVFGGRASRIGDCCKILAAEEFAYPVFTSCGSPISSSSSTASSSPPVGAGDLVDGSGAAGSRITADSASPNVGSLRPSGQVVGWPPVRTYRMNSVINHHSKNTAIEGTKVKNDGFIRSKIADQTLNKNQKTKSVAFVKVNMDGMPIGRKVDLRSHSTYQDLAITLEEMFQKPSSVNRSIKNEESSPFLDGSSGFFLTYEDKDGDWMLVGDVPWEMFLSTVQRLRIMRASDVTGLGPGLLQQPLELIEPRINHS